MSLEAETSETGAETPVEETPDFGDQIEALRARLDAVEEPAQDESEDLAADTSIGDYLSREESGGVEDDEPAYAGESGDEDGAFIEELNAYLDEAVQERVRPALEQIQRGEQERELQALAQKYPDLKKPDVLDKVGEHLGRAAERLGNPALRTDPQLVELAYMAVKAEATASAETPAQPSSGTLETGAASQPDPGKSYEQSVQERVVNAGGGNASGLW